MRRISLAFLALAALLGSRADAGLTRAYTDEVQNAAADATTGTAALELLSSDLAKIGKHLDFPLRLYSTGADAKLHIGPSIVSSGDGAGKVRPPVSALLNTSFADSTIDFQSGAVSPSGNVLTDGGTFTLPSTTIGQFRTMVLSWRSDGKVDTHFSPAAASVGALEDVGLTFGALLASQRIGYIVLQATASTAYKTANSSTSIVQMSVSGTPTIVRIQGAEASPLTTAGDLWLFTTKDSRLALGGANTVIHGGGSAPTYSNIVNADIAAGTIDLTAKVTGILPTANGGSGQNSTATFPSSGIVAVVPSSGVVHSNGSVLSASNVVLTTEVTGILPTANGGTGVNGSATFPSSGTVYANVMTSAGDFIVGGASGVPARFAVNATGTRKFIVSVSGGSTMDVLLAGDIPNFSATSVTISNIATENDFSGDGTTTDFTLSSPAQVLSASKLVQVFVDGRLQREGGGFSYTRTNASPGHIVFNGAPNSGSWVAVIVVNQ